MHREMCPCGMKKDRMGLGKVVRSGRGIGSAILRGAKKAGFTMREQMEREAMNK